MMNKKLVNIVLFSVLFSAYFSWSYVASANENDSTQNLTPPEYDDISNYLPPEGEWAREGERALMTRAILHKLTIWIKPADGKRIYVRFCRNLPHSCEREISTLVDYIFDEAIEQDFDPWLVAAIAWHESRFNAFAVSGAGAYGVLQILRRGAWAKGLPFVRQARYRRRCRRIVGSCQKPIIERAIYWLKRSAEHCGSMRNGLRMYNSGRCNGPRRYPRAVFRAKIDLLRIAENLRTRDIGFTEEVSSYDCAEVNLEEYNCQVHNQNCENENIRTGCSL